MLFNFPHNKIFKGAQLIIIRTNAPAGWMQYQSSLMRDNGCYVAGRSMRCERDVSIKYGFLIKIYGGSVNMGVNAARPTLWKSPVAFLSHKNTPDIAHK